MVALLVGYIKCEKYSKKEEALEKLQNGAKFDDVAREYSEDKARQGISFCPSLTTVCTCLKEIGGSLGWKTRGSLDGAFEKTAYELEPSSTSSPKYAEVKTGFGYHLIMVEGRR